MFYIDSLGVYVNDIESIENLAFRGLIDESVVNAFKKLHDKEINELKQDRNEYKELFEEYELRLENTNGFACENLRLIEELTEYIQYTKRLDRRKILDILKAIEKNDEEVIDS